MKIIISESRLNNIVKKFMMDRLGSFGKELSKFRRNLGHIGAFYNSDGKKMGEIHYESFDIDVDLYNLMTDMFVVDNRYQSFNKLILDIINEMFPGYDLNIIRTTSNNSPPF